MKIGVRKLNQIIYTALMALLGVFYLLAHFWKAVSGFWGLVVLILALAALVFVFMGKDRILSLLFGAFVLLQLPPLLCWISYYDIEFGIMGHYLTVGWLGFAVHLVMACWGVFLFFRRKK